jgi:hypothetical protein
LVPAASLRRTAALAAAALLTIPLGACSSGHSADPTTTTTPSTSTTLGVRDDLTSSTTTPSSTTSTTATRPLSAAVLKLSDLPSGWSVAPAPQSSRELCPGQDPFASVPPRATADATFQQGPSGPVLSSLLAAYPSAATAHSLLERSRAALAACDTYTVSGVTYHLRPIAAPGVGDEGLGAELSSDTTLGGGAHGRVLYARVGARVATIVFGGAGPVDESLALRALKAVAARL